MKYTKIFRALAIGVILSLLVIVIPANLAHADYDEFIYASPSEGEVGVTISLDGEDFDESTETENIYVSIYFSSDEAEPGDRIGVEVENYKKVKTIRVNSYGEFSDENFKVPSTLTVGDEDVYADVYYIYATYDTSRIVAVDEFTVIAAEIELDPEEEVVGEEIEISGKNFADEEEITIEYDGDDLEEDYLFECDGEEPDRDGEFRCSILIPPSIAGDHAIMVIDGDDNEAEATFTVKPSIAIGTTLGVPGDTAEVTGTGFGNRVDVDISLNGTVVTTIPSTPETDRDGNFTVSFEVPDVDEGDYGVTADDGDNEATVDFTVEKGIEVSASVTTGHVGSEITIGGFGFKANSTITITYTSEPVVFTTTSDADGAFTYTFSVPQSEAGAHTITATDGTDTLQVSFTMESQAPSIPAPLLPEMGAKASSRTCFDWEDVTDDSGVTYTLQIATSEEFTPASMVLEKTGLTSSEYTLTKEEALESTAKEAPYYWRIKAVDGASNGSGWTGVGEFYVGFSWPGWIIHLWWGLGALGAGFAGYLVGKRRSYYY